MTPYELLDLALSLSNRIDTHWALFISVHLALIGGIIYVDRPLSKREKALIGLAVAVTVQCPYCIDAYTNSSLENGSNMEQMTEAMHLASAIRGGASLIHGVQSHNAHDKVSM